ncbi:ADA HAT complex component 1 [Candida albicans P60002]|nr:ADA HAT complex component 1 [Candida albicans P60002]
MSSDQFELSDDTKPEVPNTFPIEDEQSQQQDASKSRDFPTESAKETIINRLRNIPHEELKEILTNQLDLEIQLKHRELNISDNEIGKIESQMLMLRKFFDIPNDKKLNNEPTDFTTKYFDILQKSLTSTYDNFKQLPEAPPQLNPSYLDGNKSGASPVSQPVHSYRTRSTTSSLRPSATSIASGIRNPSLGCLYRRTDGVVVRLTCPNCQRSNFSSAQGFLNHSRIAHSKEYTSQDAAALKCGDILPEIKQDLTGEASIKMLVERGLDPTRNLNVNEFLFGRINTATTSTREQNSATDGSSTMNLSSSNARKLEGKRDSGGSGGDNNEQLTQPQPITTSPTIEPSNELMKKLIKEGTMNKEEYEKLLKETKEPTSNSHLFDDETEEVGDSEESSLSTTPSCSKSASLNDRKRRQSRGGINISISKDMEVHEPEEKKLKT